MSDEKPLHVKVAEALGWTDCTLMAEVESDSWEGVDQHTHRAREVPHYDTDWSATGPLLERFGLGVDCAPGQNPHASTCVGCCGEYCALPPEDGARVKVKRMSPEIGVMACADGATALIAVCNLILALAAAGQLREVR